MSKYNYDCRKFSGYKPCSAKKLCQTCDEYDPWQAKILIIKLGALGDVLRTTPVLFAFRRKYPKAHITWVTKKNAKNMLDNNSDIDRLLFVDTPDNGTSLRLMAEEFDELHCYDKEDAAIGLASLVRAKKKFGFHLNAQGQMAPLNKASEYCFDLGLSDDLKFFKNTKTYQEVTYDCSELKVPQPMDPYSLSITDQDNTLATNVISKHSWKNQGPLIGLNTGSGKVFLTKQWPKEYFLELAKMLIEKLDAKILLLGGPDEDTRNLELQKDLNGKAFYPGCAFSIREFSAILKKCKTVVTGDTLALHLTLAMQVPPVMIFGSTCDQEVESYGLGEKIVGRPKCAPCYKNTCDLPETMKCMKDITANQVFKAVSLLCEAFHD